VSWDGLLAIYREAAETYRREQADPPVACPKCGGQFDTGADGRPFCRFDGTRPT